MLSTPLACSALSPRFLSTTLLMAALCGTPALGQSVPIVPPSATDSLRSKVCTLATPRLQQIPLLRGPWESSWPYQRNSIWDDRFEASLSYGRAEHEWIVRVPKFNAVREPDREAYQWVPNGEQEERQRRGSVRIDLSMSSSDWGDWAERVEQLEQMAARNSQSAANGYEMTYARGVAPKTVVTKYPKPAKYYVFKRKEYYDCEGAMTLQIKSQRLATSEIATRGSRGKICRIVAETDFPEVIDLQVRCEEPRFGFSIRVGNVHNKAATEEVVDQIARIILESLFEASGLTVPSTGTDPDPIIPPPVDPDPPPPVESTDPGPPSGDTEHIETDRPNEPATVRIGEMDKILGGVEDELTGRLLIIKALTQEIKRIKAEIAYWQQAKKDYNQQATKDSASARLRKLVDELKPIVKFRNEIISELRLVMSETVTEVQGVYDSYGFGELDFSAALRVEAARARQSMLMAQIELVQENGAAARRVALSMRSLPAMQSTSHYVEAMGYYVDGQLVDALETIRSAQRRGYTEHAGQPFVELERDFDIAVLGALQANALNEASRLHGANEAWLGAKARANANPDESPWDSYAIMVAQYGYYDVVTGALWGADEAGARTEQMGIELDDLSANHVGLGIVKGLRQHHSLAEIRDMDDATFRAAVEQRWGQQLTDEKAMQYRGLIRHAMQLPDMKALASDQVLTNLDVLSTPLLQRIQSSYEIANSKLYGLTQVGEAAGNLLTGRQMFFCFAGGALLPQARGLTVGAQAGGKLMVEAPTVSQFFAMSRPVQKATELLMRSPTGAKALQGMAAIHGWSQQSGGNAAVVVIGQLGLSSGSSYLAQRYLGEEAVLLIDALGVVGADSAEFYSHALSTLQKAGVTTASKAALAAARMAKQAQGARRIVSRADQVVSRIDGMVNTSTSVEAWQSLGREIMEMKEIPDRLRAALLNMAEHGGRGRANVAQQMIQDFRMTTDDLLRKADAHMRGAEQIRELAPRLPASTSNPYDEVARQAGRLKRAALEGPVPGRRMLPPGQAEGLPRLPGEVDPHAPTVSADVDPHASTVGDAGPDLPSVADDIDQAIARNLPRDKAPEAGAPDPHATTVGSESASGSAPEVAAPAGGPTPLRVNDPAAPTHTADRLLANDEFTKAIDEYEGLLDGVPPNSALAREIKGNLRTAQVTREMVHSREALQDALGDITPPPKVLSGDQPTEAARLALQNKPPAAAIEQALENNDPSALKAWIQARRAAGEPYLEPVFHAKGGKPTYSTPYYIVDGAGNQIGVAKHAVGNLEHPEGILEDFASRLGESLGLNIPRARRSGDWTVMELLPQGKTLTSLNPDSARLLSHRRELLDNMIFSMLLGDGDRHFGNLLVGIDGKLVPYDFGLADLMPTHPYRNADLVNQMNMMERQYLDQLERLRNLPPPLDPDALAIRGDNIKRLEGVVESAQRNREVLSLYAPDDIHMTPTPGTPGFEQFARETMTRQLEHGTRSWDAGNRTLSSAMDPDEVGRRINALREQIQALREAPGGDQLKEMLDASFGPNHPQREYAEQLLEERLKVMEDVFKEHLRKATSVSIWDADTTVRPSFALLHLGSSVTPRFFERALSQRSAA